MNPFFKSLITTGTKQFRFGIISLCCLAVAALTAGCGESESTQKKPGVLDALKKEQSEKSAGSPAVQQSKPVLSEKEAELIYRKCTSGILEFKNECSQSVPKLEQTCKTDDHTSCSLLSSMYELGLGVEKDLNKGKALLEESCRSSGFGCIRLALWVKNDNNIADAITYANEGIKKLNSECASGRGDSCFYLGNIYSKGLLNIEVDDPSAISFYRQSCDIDYTNGCIAYFQREPSQTDKTIFERKCKEKDEDACYWLSDYYKKANNRDMTQYYVQLYLSIIGDSGDTEESLEKEARQIFSNGNETRTPSMYIELNEFTEKQLARGFKIALAKNNSNYGKTGKDSFIEMLDAYSDIKNNKIDSYEKELQETQSKINDRLNILARNYTKKIIENRKKKDDYDYFMRMYNANTDQELEDALVFQVINGRDNGSGYGKDFYDNVEKTDEEAQKLHARAKWLITEKGHLNSYQVYNEDWFPEFLKSDITPLINELDKTCQSSKFENSCTLVGHYYEKINDSAKARTAYETGCKKVDGESCAALKKLDQVPDKK
ncbi:MAG: tetratricopeptide repeat protein [Lachnospiraceae bacterium]|nr:tetratricopeptide repeat protein [Lachnospiraceae bacterium]